MALPNFRQAAMSSNPSQPIQGARKFSGYNIIFKEGKKYSKVVREI